MDSLGIETILKSSQSPTRLRLRMRYYAACTPRADWGRATGEGWGYGIGSSGGRFRRSIGSKTRPRESEAQANLVSAHEWAGAPRAPRPGAAHASFSGVESPPTREPHA